MNYSARKTRDHPRVCGEHIKVYNGLDSRTGSSPRMRGAPTGRSGYWTTTIRIIPAYAGSTLH